MKPIRFVGWFLLSHVKPLWTGVFLMSWMFVCFCGFELLVWKNYYSSVDTFRKQTWNTHRFPFGCGSKPMAPFWGVRCTTHFRTYFSGWIEWNVHWGITGILTHGFPSKMALQNLDCLVFDLLMFLINWNLGHVALVFFFFFSELAPPFVVGVQWNRKEHRNPFEGSDS